MWEITPDDALKNVEVLLDGIKRSLVQALKLSSLEFLIKFSDSGVRPLTPKNMLSDSARSIYNSVTMHYSPVPQSAASNASSYSSRVGTPIPTGQEIAARIDIPSYTV